MKLIRDKGRSDPRRSTWATVIAVSAIAIPVAAMTAPTAGGAASDSFTCRASVLKLGNFEPYRANAPNDPCIADEEGLSGRRYVGNGLAVEGITSARTERRGGAPTNRVVSGHSEVGDLEWRRAGKPSLIHARAVTSYARVDCSTGSPIITSNSHITGLEVNGHTITAGSHPMQLNLGAGTLYLNRTIQRPNEVIVRPIEFDRSDGTTYLKVAESRAGRIGNPCS